MYGYVTPFKEKLSMPDFVLYRSFYCGLCKSTGRQFGQFPRFTTNYDMTFFSVFVHDCMNHDVTIKEEKCILNPFKKKPVASGALVDKVAAANIILSYYKAVDGCYDGDGMKMRMAKRMLKKPFEKAAKILPDVEEAVRIGYAKLREDEKNAVRGIDRVSDRFASVLRSMTQSFIGENADGYKSGVAYNIGKLVYLMDALDDVGEDAKKKRYNPLIAEYGYDGSREKFLETNRDELSFVLNSAANRAIADFNNIVFTQSRNLMANILYHGIREKIKELLCSKKKLPKPKI